MTGFQNCDVAIIGMSGLFPKAADVDAFWRNILDKVDAIGDAPEGWLVDESFFDETGERKNISVYTQRGGFLNELSQFDPKPFGTMPISVVGGEPDQFLALKGSAEALADAGYGSGRFDSHRTGIILGHAIHANRANVGGFQHSIVVDQTVALVKCLFPEAPKEKVDAIEALLFSKLPKLNVDTVPGLVPNMMTGRIANRLDLMGPNYIMDAACASSLIAVEAAINELRFGRADLMLAGGVNTTTSPLVYAVFCMLEALSRSSRIRPFDKSANGTLLAEGQGIFVLKRLDDALRDGDRVYAVVKAVGTSSDGRAIGLMAPRLEGEVLAMMRAYEQCDVDPRTIGLVEAHGTGIPLGDRTEIQALRQILGHREKPFPHVALGSVKSMIGHCIPAAGAASLIKMCMALHHKILPPTLVEEINPDLELQTTPLYLSTDAAPWIRPGLHPRRAAINAFGFGGVNSHMVLEEAPGTSTIDPTAAFGIRPPNAASLFVFAGGSREELAAALQSLGQRLGRYTETELASLAVQTIRGIGAGGHRAAIVATGVAELARKLDQVLAKLADPAVHRMHGRNGAYFTDRPIDGRVVLLFPGENSQYPGMLKDLATSSPVAREWFDMLEGLFAAEREIPHSVLLFPPPNNLDEKQRTLLEQELLQVDAGSEAVFFADQALFSVLSRLGVKPDFIVGHSTGENAAIIASGLTDLTREQVGRYIVEMNRIYRKLEQEQSIPEGSLLTVGALSRETLLDVIDGEADVWFTMDNCPNQAVLYGPADVMDGLAKKLSAAGGLCLKLPLVWAYHTPFVAPMADAFEELFSEINFREPIAELHSCASAEAFPKKRKAVLDLMKRQYVGRVRFTEVIERLYEKGARIFVEVGPNNNLTGFVRDILRDRPHVAVAADDPKRSSFLQIQHLLAQLFIHGVPVDLSLLYPGYEADAADRPDAGKSQRATPHLRSELPYLKLSEEEAARVRGLLTGGGEARPASPASPPVVTAEEVTTLPPAVPPRPNRSVATSRKPQASTGMLSNHFQMMNEFLGQQERITGAALERKGLSSPVTTRDISVVFGLPSRTDVCLAAWSNRRGHPTTGNGLGSMAQTMLSAREQTTWRGDIAGRPHRRQREWLLGRVAAKKAVQLWFARARSGCPRFDQIEILYGDNNRPVVSVLGLNGDRGTLPHISLSHVDGAAVAVSSSGSVGIDLESPARIRNPEGVAQLTFCDAERDILNRRFGDDTADATAFLWSIKEAAAKLDGTGLLGRERAVRLLDLADDARSARVDCFGTEVSVHIRRIGSLCCSIAVPRSG